MHEHTTVNALSLLHKWVAECNSDSINLCEYYVSGEVQGEVMFVMKRSALYVIVILLVCCFVGYRYVNESGSNALWVNESKWFVTGYPRNTIPLTHQYYFKMKNTSGRSIKLLDIKLSNCEGVSVSNVSIPGKRIDGLLVPKRSDITVNFDVVYKLPPIKTPQMASVTYRSLGITHVQRVTIYSYK